jgi:hypothetical protein
MGCHSEEEATWETENFLRSNYPDFLPHSEAHVEFLFVSLETPIYDFFGGGL